MALPCAVPSCPALARPNHDTCPIHQFAILVGTRLPSWAVCTGCRRVLKPTDWVRSDSLAAESAKHIACEPRSHHPSKRQQREARKPLWEGLA